MLCSPTINLYPAQRNPSRKFILICRRLNRPRSNEVHNNKNMSLIQPKRLAWWVRTALTFMLCSPTINFRCGNNPKISPVTHRTQHFPHMTTHAHNLEGYYRLRVQFFSHKDFRDLTETLTGSPVNVWPRDIFTYFSDLRLWYHLLESATESGLGIYTHMPASQQA
jgi:hypothetical protein